MEKRRKREAEKQRQLEYEQQRKADLAERQQLEAAKEAAKRKAEEERRKEEEAAEESRKVREQQRKAALEELQKVRRQSQAVREDIAKELAVAADDKENIPKNGGGHILPADLIEKKSVEEQKRKASYGVVKNVLEQDSVHRKEAESVVAASRKAAEEVADVKTRIEASMERSGRGEQEGPVYYGINSTARRSSQDRGGAGAKKDINVINDEVADVKTRIEANM